MPPHALEQKEGVTVKLIRNLSPKQGLYNGTRLCITGLKDNVIKVEIAIGYKLKLQFESVGTQMDESVFSHGQLLVA